METKTATAHLHQVRISPRKIKVILDLIRSKDAATAGAILKTTNKLACEDIGKLLKSAVANATHNYEMDPERLYVAQAYVTPGSLKGMKRIMPRAKGSADRIVKRTSHVTLVLKEKE